MARLTPGTMTVVVFALLVGLAGAYVVRHQLNGVRPAGTQGVSIVDDSVMIPVALTDLEAGRELSLNDIGKLIMTQAEYAQSPQRLKSHLTTAVQIQGRTLKTALKKGATFGVDDLYPFGDGPGIVDNLEPGYRAVSVPIQDVGAVKGFARPGSYVDVLFRSSPEAERPEVTMTLFERVQVLAINSTVVQGANINLDSAGTVTMAVTPHQAKMLKVVEGRGEISLVLRHPDDDFQFLPFDPSLDGALSETDRMRPNVLAASFPVNAAAAGVESDSIDGIDRIIGNASERVTMEDLLGLSASPREQSMDLYLGSQKQTLKFDEPAADELRVLRQGGRISTPIVEYPVRPRRTARLDK